MKGLYFVNRYLCLPFMIVIGYLFTAELNAATCAKVVQFEPYSLVAITFICDVILSVRTYALWGKNKFLGAFLGVVVCSELAIQSWAAEGGAFVQLQALGIKGCIWASTAKKMNAFFAVSSFVILLTFTLTTLRIVTMWQKTGRSTLLVALLRDGALYFAIVFAVSLLNLISFVTQTPKGNPALHSPLAEVITSIMCTRIILSTRRHGAAADSVSTHGVPTDFSFKRTLNGQRSNVPYGQQTFGTATLPGAINVQREVTVDFDVHDPSSQLNEKRAYGSPDQSYATTPTAYPSTPVNQHSTVEMKPMAIRIQDRPEWD